MKLLLPIFMICFSYINCHGQIHAGGIPYSSTNEIIACETIKNKNYRILIDQPDMEAISSEDEINKVSGKPFRYGINYKVNYDLQNSGYWTILENGDMIWRLDINCKNAKSINLSYRSFHLPYGARLFVYNKSKTSVLGAFTEKNNQGTINEPKGFATALVFDENITLEYYLPSTTSGRGTICISNIIYGYIDVNSKVYNNTSCTINVNCSPEGDNIQDQKSSVARIFMNGYNCTGTLINNTQNNGIPYFLTANHCMAVNNLDADTDPDAYYYIFYWNDESLDCEGNDLQIPSSTVGATIVSNFTPSDFALLKLTENPYDHSDNIQPYFSGWDRQIPGGGNYSIHHPIGGIKKISVENDIPTTFNNEWILTWDSTYNGYSTTNGGSSGAALFNSSNKIIAQAWYAQGFSCSGQTVGYGKFDLSWNMGSTVTQRLKEWLDPEDENSLEIDGTYCLDTTFIQSDSFVEDSTIYVCTAKLNAVSVNNQSKLIINALYDVLIDNDFELTADSELEIK